MDMEGLLEYLKEVGKADHEQIAQHLNLPVSTVAAWLKILEHEGAVKLMEEEKTECIITHEGQRYLEEGFPEERAVGKPISEMGDEERKVGIAWAKRLMDAKIESGVLVSHVKESPHRRLIQEHPCDPVLVKRGLSQVKVRRKLIAQYLKPYKLEGIGKLTKEHILSGAWKNARPYNIEAKGKQVPMGKRHPISYLMEKIKTIFLSMGFKEMRGSYVGPAFWSFDALFLPQDHPAREAMDTFYLKGKEEVPQTLLDKVGKEHKRIWGIWNEEVAKQRILRPHTTALSSQYLSRLKGPAKLFAVGKVFRNESIDYKHLAEFYQVEGIVAWEKANFRQLIGILKEFYKRLGFPTIRLRPHYFPFTEPSLEIDVWFKDEWIELGGAGILRPEVSIPLSGMYPVLAWGLSLERPLVLSMGLKDIRELYR